MALKLARCEPAFLKALPVTTVPSLGEEAADDSAGGRRSAQARQSNVSDEYSSRRSTIPIVDVSTPPRRGLGVVGSSRFTFDVLSQLSMSSSNLILSPSQTPPPGIVRKRFDMFFGRFFGSSGDGTLDRIRARGGDRGEGNGGGGKWRGSHVCHA